MSFKHPERATDYLEHMEMAAETILAYTADMSSEQFAESRITVDAVIRNIEVIGEAAKNFRNSAPAVVEATPDIGWTAIIGMRNAISHGYFSVDLDVVWNTVEYCNATSGEREGAARGSQQRLPDTATHPPGSTQPYPPPNKPYPPREPYPPSQPYPPSAPAAAGFCCDAFGRKWCRIVQGAGAPGAPCYCVGVPGTGLMCN